MGATYTVSNYLLFFLVYTIGCVLLMLLLTIWFGRKLLKKHRHQGLAYIPLLGLFLLLLLMGSYAVPILNQIGDLLIPSEYVIKTTAGQIDNITPAKQAPPHYVDNEFRSADYLHINGKQFYTISDDSLVKGMYVEVQYAAFENNVIFTWQSVSQERAEKVQEANTITESVPTEMPKTEVPDGIKKLARWFYYIGFAGMLGIISLNHIADYKITSYLLKKDSAIYNKIIPHPSAIFLACAPFIFLALIAIGLSLENAASHLLFVFLPFIGVLLTFMLSKLFTRMTINSQFLTLSKFGRETTYLMADINTVYFQSCRGYIGKQLVIVFKDGKSYWFDMDHYLGVQNAYNTLTKAHR